MQKGSVAVPFLLVTLILIVVGGYYFFINKSPKLNPVVSIKQDIKESVKIYNNQSLGFEFKYAKDLKVLEDSEEEFNKRGNGDFHKNFKGYVGYEPGKFLGEVVVLDKDNSYDNNPFTVWVFNNDNNLTIDEWYKNFWYYPFVWGDFTYKGKVELAPKTEATISGQMGKSGIIDYSPGKPKFVYVSKDGRMYLFRIIGESGEKVLSTFNFL